METGLYSPIGPWVLLSANRVQYALHGYMEPNPNPNL